MHGLRARDVSAPVSARIASLEVGAQLTWLSRHLGHLSVTVTSNVYGHWQRGERRRQAQQLAGAFGI